MTRTLTGTGTGTGVEVGVGAVCIYTIQHLPDFSWTINQCSLCCENSYFGWIVRRACSMCGMKEVEDVSLKVC